MLQDISFSHLVVLLGIDLAIRDAQTGEKIEGNGVSGVLTVEKPWPGMARTVYNDHQVNLATSDILWLCPH